MPRRILPAAIAISLLGACSNQEQTLRPYSAVGRAQALDLKTDGYLIAVEKYPRADIGAPAQGSTEGYRPPTQGEPGSDARERHEEFKDVMGDRKTMVITHLVSYFPPADAEDGSLSRRFLYNAYEQETWRPRENLTESCRRPCMQRCERPLQEYRGEGRDRDTIQSCEERCDAFASGLYDAGLRQLPLLRRDLQQRLRAASAAGRPYTHLLVMSMGWANSYMCEQGRPFNVLAWPADRRQVARAIADAPEQNVLVLDTTEVVSDHNDVLDESMAALMWCAMHPLDADGDVSQACLRPSGYTSFSEEGGTPCP